MKIKKTTVKKYVDGVASTSAAPKKMNFVKKFINKQREKEQAFQDYSDAEDAAAAPSTTITQEKSFVGPQLTGLDKAINTNVSDDAKLDAVSAAKESSVPTAKTKTAHNNGSQEDVRKWQERRGLKADGIWGKDTQAQYKKEQDAKASKKMAIGKKTTTTPEVTKTEVVATKPSTVANGQRDKAGNTYFSNGRMMDKNGKMSNGKVPTVTKTVVKKSPEDSAREAEYLYPDPELHGSRVNRKEDAEALAAIDKKGEEATGNLLRNIGIGATGTALIAGSVYAARRKGKGSSKTGKAVAEGISDFASEMSGKSRNVGKVVSKVAGEVKPKVVAKTNGGNKMNFTPTESRLTGPSQNKVAGKVTAEGTGTTFKSANSSNRTVTKVASVNPNETNKSNSNVGRVDGTVRTSVSKESPAARQPQFKGAVSKPRHTTEDFAKWGEDRANRAAKKAEQVRKKGKQVEGLPQGITKDDFGNVYSQTNRPMSNSEVEKLASSSSKATSENTVNFPTRKMAGVGATPKVEEVVEKPVVDGREFRSKSRKQKKAEKNKGETGKREVTAEEKKKSTSAKDLF